MRRKTIERLCIQRHVGAYSGQQILGAYRPPLLERAALLQKPHRFQSQSDPRPVHWALRKVTAGGTFMPARAIQRGAHLRIRFSELLAASAPSRQRPCGDSSGTISMKPCTSSQELGSRLRPQAMKGVLRWCGAMRQQREATGFDILQRTSGLVSSASEPGRTRLVCQWTRTCTQRHGAVREHLRAPGNDTPRPFQPKGVHDRTTIRRRSTLAGCVAHWQPMRTAVAVAEPIE